MILRTAVVSIILCVGAPSVLADEAADRAKLAGKWQPKAGENTNYGTWTLRESEGAVRVTQELNGEKVAEYECNTMGRECGIKEAGHAATVSMWFNGPRLVEMRTRGSEVIKRRFRVTGEGDMMELEVIPIAPAGKPEVIHLSRLTVESDHKSQ